MSIFRKDSEKDTIKPNVAIIGGGIAGLVASIYLEKGGYKVALFEKNALCGGLVNSFKREGFTFDGGVPALLNSRIIKPMLKEIDLNLEFTENKVSIGVESEIIHVTDKESFQEYGEMLKKLYPDSKSDIDRFIKVVRRIVRNAEILYSLDNPFFVDMKKEIKKYLPWLLKFLKVIITMKKLQVPVDKFVLRLLKNPSAASIVTQHFFKNTPAFFALSYFYIYNDYIYPKGGVGQFARALEEKAKELGVEILYNTEIEKVDVDSKILEDMFGNKYSYDKLLWAADLKRFYKIVEVSKKTNKERFEKERKKILRSKSAESVFKVFLGVDEPPENFSSISNPHFFYTPSRIGINGLDKDELSKVKTSMNRKEISDWLHRFCERSSYEISIPVLRDKTLAPEGKTGIIVNFFFDYDLTKKIYDAGWYNDFKMEVEDNIVSMLNNSIYPGIKERVIFKFSSTPLTISRYVGTSEGSIVGWAFGQSLPIKNNLMSSFRTPLLEVYKAGQWVYQPAGVPIAILTGKQAALNILRK